MAKELLKKEGKAILFGNEAIVRGALEAGVGYSSSYPGTPATEIGDAFSSIAKEQGIYFEWSTNEKVALEGAAGAAFSGTKSLVSMKHYGLNVASDSLLPLVYLECPLVVVVSDDPGCWSSVQTEQDMRWYSKMGKIPTLEPSDSQEVKEMTKFAFEMAWKYKIPVIIRLVTRVCYSKSLVNLGKIEKKEIKGDFKKKKFLLGSAITVKYHKDLLEKIEKIKKEIESSKFNIIEKGKGEIGIITTNVAYTYVKEAFEILGIEMPLLKLGFSYPFPSEKVKEFAKNLKKVLIVEELDPIIENEVKKLGRGIEVHGKDLFPEAGEFRPEHVVLGLSKFLNKKIDKDIEKSFEEFDSLDIPKRIPLFCAGCPHRATFYAIKKVLGREKIFMGDIGCYMLGTYVPYEIEDLVVAMGASEGIGHGISKVTKKKPVIFIGDSTFLHAGIPAMLNLVYNKADALVVIMSNSVTAMCGGQPHPGTGNTAMAEQTKKISLGDISKACQADFVKTSNVWNFAQLCKDIKEAYEKKGVSVLVAEGACKLYTVRQLARQGKDWPRFEIIKQKKELDEFNEFGCPAIMKQDGKWFIDEKLCWGCTICKQFFPDCIKIKERK